MLFAHHSMAQPVPCGLQSSLSHPCMPVACRAIVGACRLIFTLREYPTTEDFVYLRRFKRWPADCNPYALEVVQFADIDQAHYYTMSVRGITHYIDGINAEFASVCKL